MEWLIMMLCILTFIIGLILGLGGHKVAPVGTLRIDNSDPEDGPYLFLELSTDPKVLMKEKEVLLKVDTKSYLTQK
jgi:hypothetical protein